MDKVLNKELYTRLQKVFGLVEVFSQGERATYTYDKGSIYEPVIGKVFARNVSGGEHYAIRCPFCKKDRKLWLSYLANSHIKENGIDIFFHKGLIICYRCHFNSDKDKLNAFWNMLYTGVKSSFSLVETPESVETVTQEVRFPKTVPILDPSVPSRVTSYLINRGMDLKELEDVYHVGYSEDSKILVKGVPRIIFPIIQNGEMVAWQGRCLNTDVERWKVPKYQFPAGAKIKWMLYNGDVARWQPYAIITEGVTDVIACGKPGVAVFGKTVSQRQVEMLISYWGERGVIRIPDMDDPEAYTVAKEELTRWNASGLFKKGAHLVIPPKGKDPGDMTRSEIYTLIQQQTGILLT